MQKLLLVFVAFTALACNPTPEKQSAQNDENQENPPNVILMIGDGMGLSQISSLYAHGKEKTNFDRFPHIGLIKTASSSHKITDSAAGATAFATGNKSYNGAISVDADTASVQTIAEYAAKKGWKTGLVATSSITHATPACFYAHIDSRNKEESIARQLVHAPIDFFAGGGQDFFSKRSDNINYMDSLRQKGFEMHTQWETDAQNTSAKQGFLLSPNGMPKRNEGRGNYLPEAAEYAMQQLASDSQRFFLMVEGSQIDWAGHANDAEYLQAEMQDFNNTLEKVLDFAEKDGNTLVVVTADHETGGYALTSTKVNGSSDYDSISDQFITNGHTAALIPVFAFGPGAEHFDGLYENTAIYDKLKPFVKNSSANAQ